MGGEASRVARGAQQGSREPRGPTGGGPPSPGPALAAGRFTRFRPLRHWAPRRERQLLPLRPERLLPLPPASSPRLPSLLHWRSRPGRLLHPRRGPVPFPPPPSRPPPALLARLLSVSRELRTGSAIFPGGPPPARGTRAPGALAGPAGRQKWAGSRGKRGAGEGGWSRSCVSSRTCFIGGVNALHLCGQHWEAPRR